MNIVRNIGKFSWKDTSSIRKAMSKNLGEEFFNNFLAQFIKGAGEQGIEEAVARSIWNRVYTFGSWAFNLSHSVSYALLSYWCAYIKTYWPAQFYARILKGEGNEDKIRAVLREWGGEFIGLDISKSKLDWTVTEDNELVGGLTSIKGLGPSKAQKVIDAQPFESLEDMQTRLPKGIAKTLTTAVEEGMAWTNLNAIAEAGAEGIKKIKLTSNPIDLGELVDDDKISEKVGYIVMAKVLHIDIKNSNQEDKVAKRGYAVKGPSEYAVLKIKDDASHAILILNRFFVDKNRQQVLPLKDKICLFKVHRLESGLLDCKKIKELS